MSTLRDQIYETIFLSSEEEKKAKLKSLLSFLKEEGYSGGSTFRLYQEFSKKFLGFTVPAFNLRILTYDLARCLYRVAKKLEVGAVILEIARSEMGYTKQTPLEYAVCVLAAARDEGYPGPIFLQGDHFQANRKSYFANPEGEKRLLKNLIDAALEAQFYNIDIDASTLVDLEREDLKEQQRPNYELTAELGEYIRNHQPPEITVTLGGEIGEIGGKNSTPEELRAFLSGFKETFKGKDGLSKISIQTGTSHGGIVLPDGQIAKIALDFNLLQTLSRIAREEFGLAGAVQHGASTLPEEYFELFPAHECVEVHLATGIQNFIYDHPALPDEFRNQIYHFLKQNFASEWKEGMTEAQFIYKVRKKGFGAFKKDWWNLAENIREAIVADLEEYFAKIFTKLQVKNTLSLVQALYRS